MSAWTCRFGHHHDGPPDAAGCPDYIEKVWRPAGVVEAEVRRIEMETARRVAAAKAWGDESLRSLMLAQPNDVLLYLVLERGRKLAPEEAELARRFAGETEEGA